MRAILAFLLLALGSSVRCLSLEPLCPGYEFEYEDVRVNAIHRIQINVTLEPVSYFMVPWSDNCLGYKWFSSLRKSQAKTIMNDYNRLVIRLYSERSFNLKELDSSPLVLLIEIIEMVQQMRTIADEERSLVDKCLNKKFIAPMLNCVELIRHWASLRFEELPQTDDRKLRLGKNEIFEKFETELARIDNDLTNSQTMAFQFDLVEDVYPKRIVQMLKFVFHKKSKVVFDQSSTGTLHFEIILPFEDTELKDLKFPFCVSIYLLPDFFFRNKQAKMSQATSTPVSDEPTETKESSEPSEPTESTEPTATDPTEPTESTESGPLIMNDLN